MTIAMCYQSPEGLVLGADSTASTIVSPSPGQTGYHYFNHHQKLYELGENSTVGVLTWNLGNVGPRSYRTLFALLDDDIRKKHPKDVAEIASRWAGLFWNEYSTSAFLAPHLQRCKQLNGKKPFDPNASTPDPTARTKDEEDEFQNLKRNLVAGFCIAGYWLPIREASAFEVIFDPLAGKPSPLQLPPLSWKCWGAPNMIMRLINGYDDNVKAGLLASGKWNGTPADLDNLLSQHALAHPLLPIRDAIDFVHACIYSTVKGMKFSNFFQICGGPIELAVVTSDRRFRWVRHKVWDAAISEE